MPKKKLTDPFIRNYPAPDKRVEVYDEIVPGLVLRVTPNGAKSFAYRYYIDGTNKRITIGPLSKWSLAAARDEARKLAQEISRGIDPAITRSKKKNEFLRVRDLTELFIEGHLKNMRPRTAYEYERILNVEVLPKMGKRTVREVGRGDISLLLHPLYERTPTLANKVRAVISSLFAFGIDRELIEMQNPVSSLKKRYREKSRSRYLSNDEIKTLWAAIEQQAEPTASIFKMLLMCGQRSGETCQMKWADIKGIDWHIPAELTKNKQPHSVPLSDAAIEIIEKLRPLTGQSAYVFESPISAGKPVLWLQKARLRLTEITGIEFRIHDLRRTAATKLAEIGTDRTVLAKILNHKSGAGDDLVTAVYDRYDYSAEKRRYLQLWADNLTDILYSTSEREANIVRIH